MAHDVVSIGNPLMDILIDVEEGFLKELITTDAVYQPPEVVSKPWYTQISVAPLFAEAIFRLNTNHSLGPLLSPFKNSNKPKVTAMTGIRR